MWRAGSITADALYLQQGSAEWASILLIVDLLDPPQPSATPPSRTPQQSSKDVGKNSTIGWVVILLLIVGGCFICWENSEKPKRELAAALNSFFHEADELAAMTSLGTTHNDFSNKLSKVIARYNTLEPMLKNIDLVDHEGSDLKTAIFGWTEASRKWNSDNVYYQELASKYLSGASNIYLGAKSKLSKYAK